MLLDVVYNHFGPEGNYLPLHAPDFRSSSHRTPWGEAINFDGFNAGPVRKFFLENAEYWLDAFHLDGLRLDAVHAIRDDSIPDVLAEMTQRLRSQERRTFHIVVEDDDNVAERLTRSRGEPLQFTAQWNDDIHHVLHVAATGEQGGYYAAYGSTELLARAIAEGFAYQGEIPAHRDRPRGGPSDDLPPSAFIAFLQNHDQIGNRAVGERLETLAPPEAVLALTSVVLLSPQTPALFMGEEWGARSPFPFFCDFGGDLATAVREGRRKEFARFAEFSDPTAAQRIPDPTLESTFHSAKLDWRHRDGERLHFFRAALAARRTHVRPLAPSIARGGDATIFGDQAVRVVWHAGDMRLTLDANLSSVRNRFSAGGAACHLALRRYRGRIRTLERSLESFMIPPRATYRLQLRKGFGFDEAAAVAPYLGRLGISHVYLSPFFKARPESAHGYDVTDHAALNPELGTERSYRAMIAALHQESLRIILDVVPNHMGVGGADNPLWLDVLEWGSDSRYANWFDIDWRARDDEPRGKVLAPILGRQYGEELRSGNLALAFEDGAFAIWAYGVHRLPVCPLTYPAILGGSPPLDDMADLFLDLPQWVPQMAERADVLKRQLAILSRDDIVAHEALERRVADLNRDCLELGRLISAQNWRAAFFRVAEDEINYRRFFNINDLAGLRMELEPVFAHTHRRVLSMLKDGEIDGLRIDHVDGLFDPKAYLLALRRQGGSDFYLAVEKILAPHERLRRDWPVEGETGYAFLNLLLGLLVEPSGETAFNQAWREFGGEHESFADVARASKLRILEIEMASELNALGRTAARLARSSPMTADLTRGLLQRALKQTIASFPVYRTYVDLDGVISEDDRRDIAWAISRARKNDPDLHPSAFDFLEQALTANSEALKINGLSRTAALRFAMKFQQLSGPVMAKGVEDTAFYRYNRFIALNEVGGAPDRFGIGSPVFHRANARRSKSHPFSMLASATHDTKRGEDTRARLAVLSEVPDDWNRQLATWRRILRAGMGNVEAAAPPTPADEYLIYQMLVGSWPLELLKSPAAAALALFAGRFGEAARKALREGKRNSNWNAPNLEYEEATLAFVNHALDPRNEAFLGSFLPFVARIARLGIDNSLVQTALKLTAPGVPDIYQGCELWDFSLVDPDNRRPVAYDVRRAALAEIDPILASPDLCGSSLERLMDCWADGRVKLATIALLLRLRREDPELFSAGDYHPLEFSGEDAGWACGFRRSAGATTLIVIVALRPAMRAAKPLWEAYAELPTLPWRRLVDGLAIDLKRPVREWMGLLPFVCLLARR